MPSLEDDLEFFKVGVAEMESYLLSDELFWPLAASSPRGRGFPRLTLGGLLLARARVLAQATTRNLQMEIQRLEANLEVVRTRWRAAWERKALREFSSRLSQWRNYLEDYRQDREAHGAYYPHEVRWRVMLQMLQEAGAKPSSTELELLAALDQAWHAILLPADFIWEASVQSEFPPQVYWYLHARPPERGS